MQSSELMIHKDEVSHYTRITPDDIDNLDTDKLSDALLKALYAVNSALFSNAENEVSRLNRFKGALDHLEEELTSSEYLDSLCDHDKLKIYKTLQNNSTKSSDYLLKLSMTMSNGLDSISKIKAAKSTMEQKAPINIPQSKEERKILLSSVQEELKRREESKDES